MLPVVWSLWYGPFQDPRVGRGMPFLFRFGTRRHFPLCGHVPFMSLFLSGLWALEDSRGSRHFLRKLWTSKVCWKKHFLTSWEEAMGFSPKNHSHTVDAYSERSWGTISSSHLTLVVHCPCLFPAPFHPAFLLLGICLVPHLTCLRLYGYCNKALQSAIVKQGVFISHCSRPASSRAKCSEIGCLARTGPLCCLLMVCVGEHTQPSRHNPTHITCHLQGPTSP